MRFVFRPRIQADPVSLAIAWRAAQRSNIQEDQLNYGFKKRPIDQLPRARTYPNIPEEKLFDLNSRVIEFKPPTYPEEDEFRIDESDEEMGSYTQRKTNDQDKECSGFAYSDIGYSELSGKDPRFINVPLSTTPNPCAPITDNEYTGRIITLPDERNNYMEQLIAEYLNQGCEPPSVISR